MNMMTYPLLMLGTWEIVAIVAVVLLLFGGKKLPEMMRGLGRGISEFKKGAAEVTEPREETKKEVDGVARE